MSSWIFPCVWVETTNQYCRFAIVPTPWLWLGLALSLPLPLGSAKERDEKGGMPNYACKHTAKDRFCFVVFLVFSWAKGTNPRGIKNYWPLGRSNCRMTSRRKLLDLRQFCLWLHVTSRDRKKIGGTIALQLRARNGWLKSKYSVGLRIMSHWHQRHLQEHEGSAGLASTGAVGETKPMPAAST